MPEAYGDGRRVVNCYRNAPFGGPTCFALDLSSNSGWVEHPLPGEFAYDGSIVSIDWGDKGTIWRVGGLVPSTSSRE